MDDLERSGEGSAPNGSGSKDGVGNSRVALKSGSGGNGSGGVGSGGVGNGNSATKQCQGSNQPNGESAQHGNNSNSATKDGNAAFGDGNGASTLRQVRAWVGTCTCRCQ